MDREGMSLFDFDLCSNRASRCETNHFHIVLGSKLKWPFSLNDQRVKGLFMHEYIHYIQHLSTLCGISLSEHYNHLFVEYRNYFEHHDTIEMPLQIEEIAPKMSGFFEYFNKIKGTRKYDNRVDEVLVKKDDIERSRIERTAVPVSTYNRETEQWNDLHPLKVGYYSIIESMADMVQRIYDPGVEHDDSPYLIVQKICENVYPDVCKDHRMIIALCICALMDSNPGVGLFDAIDYAKSLPEVNGYYYYCHYVRDRHVKLPNGEEISILEMFNRRLSDYRSTVSIVFGREEGYYTKAIDNALIGANTGRNMLLSLLYDDRISPDEYIDKLADFYGFPYIEAHDLTLWPGQQNQIIDAAAAIGFEILFKRLSSRDDTDCPRAEVCRRNGAYEYECKYDQWNHSSPCPFTSALHYFHLEGKQFEQRRAEEK